MHEMTKTIYLFIRDFMEGSDGRPPTIREIGMGVRPERPLSCSLVHHHLNYLEEFGLIERVRIRDTGKRVIQLLGARFVAPPMPEMGWEGRFAKRPAVCDESLAAVEEDAGTTPVVGAGGVG